MQIGSEDADILIDQMSGHLGKKFVFLSGNSLKIAKWGRKF